MKLKGLFSFSVSSVLSVLCVFPGVATAFDPVTPGRTLELPRDAGAHLDHRIELLTFQR